MKNLMKPLLVAAVSVLAVSCMDDGPEIPTIYGLSVVRVEQIDDEFLPRIGIVTDGKEALSEGIIMRDNVLLDGYRVENSYQIYSERYATDDITELNGDYEITMIGVDGTEEEYTHIVDSYTSGMRLGEVAVSDLKVDDAYVVSATFDKVDGAEYYGFYVAPFANDNLSIKPYVYDGWHESEKASDADTQVVKLDLKDYYRGLPEVGLRLIPFAMRGTLRGEVLYEVLYRLAAEGITVYE